MNQAQKELFQKLSSFKIDPPGVEFPFQARLGKENGWDLNYAGRVIEEYWRFVFMAMEAGHPVTPSEDVDQAWHLHLIYSRSYAQMNEEILARPLHHNPTQGGASEDTKHKNWYEETKKSYERFFGHAPPEDIWPPSHIRFAPVPNFARVNLGENWVIAKQKVRSATMAVATGVASLLVVGCAGMAGVAVFSSGLMPFIFGAFILSGIGLVIWAISRLANPGNGRGNTLGCGTPTGCSYTSSLNTCHAQNCPTDGNAGGSESGDGSGDSSCGCSSSSCSSGCGSGCSN